MQGEFENRVAVVTGGAKGIGAASSRILGRGGACVVILDMDNEGRAIAEEIGLDGGAAHFISTDLSQDQAVRHAFEEIQHRFGGADLIHCNAGIQRYGTVVDTSLELWNEVFVANVTSVFLALHYALKQMMEKGGGAAVITASVQAFAAQQGVAAYSASKGALLALTRAAAVDHAKAGIRVNAVAPGSVDTPMLRWSAAAVGAGRDPNDLIAEWGKSHALGRVAQATEVAEVAAFLLSPRASFVTGSVYGVDGGLLAQLPVRIPS